MAGQVRHVCFDMANDSHLFRTVAQLEAEGFYPCRRQPLEDGARKLYLPLYEGKMVHQAFDHQGCQL